MGDFSDHVADPRSASAADGSDGSAGALTGDPEVTVDADAEIVAGRAAPSQRRRLDRTLVVETAITFIDDYGLAGLSMRRLGAVLGVEAMALYRYTSGKEELLDAVVETLVEQMRADPEMLDAPSHGWQDFLQRLAHGVRRVALAHPQAFPLLASRPPQAPWLRPPLRNVDWVERFLCGLIDEGFSDRGAVEAYRAFTSFLLGHLLLEVSTQGADVGPLDTLQAEHSASLKELPTVHRLSRRLAEDHTAAEFEQALETLLDRLQLVRSEADRPGESPR